MLKQDILNLLPEKIHISGEHDTRQIFIDGKELLPADSLVIRKHSLDGFAWGYGGSGPSQLALAILLIYLPWETAVEYYQAFKWKQVAAWPQQDFEITLPIRHVLNCIIK